MYLFLQPPGYQPRTCIRCPVIYMLCVPPDNSFSGLVQHYPAPAKYFPTPSAVTIRLSSPIFNLFISSNLLACWSPPQLPQTFVLLSTNVIIFICKSNKLGLPYQEQSVVFLFVRCPARYAS